MLTTDQAGESPKDDTDKVFGEFNGLLIILDDQIAEIELSGED